ncbi:MAG TPA: D-alanyl-D-alanine endopeptidase [Steroidobacteraceae bacterium]|jgi:D-alanyl-D-alanine endopeptidase (penicillin-binding protein 7)
MSGGKLTTLLAVAGVLALGLNAPTFAATTHKTHHRRHVAVVLSADDPGLKSSAAYVVDEDDSSVWYSRNATVASPIASITKLMTALVVADAHQPLDEVLQVTAEDRAIGKGAASRLAVGTKLTRGELLHLALMASENRAAHALGRNYPGGIPAFARAMNEKAQSLGMKSSHFVEPTGLSSENVASPEDLSRLVMAAAQNPTIRDFSTDTEHSVKIGRHMVEFRTTDALVRNPGWNIIVQKTGYITEAGRCLVMQAVIGGRNVVIVLLNSFGKYTRVADAVRMRRWIEARMSEHAAHVVASSNS